MFLSLSLSLSSFCLDKILLCGPGRQQWPDHGSLQPRTPGLKQSSYLSLLSNWDYRHTTSLILFIYFYCRDKRQGISLLPRLRCTAWSWLTATSASRVQAIHQLWPPKVLGLQGWATVPGRLYTFTTKHILSNTIITFLAVFEIHMSMWITYVLLCLAFLFLAYV